MTLADPHPRDPLAPARRLFLEHGYQATSMEQVAVAMGVAKQTLYNRFESKENLFARVVAEGAERFLVTLREGRGELRQDLIHFARAFRGILLSAEGLAMYRLLMGEAARFPSLARAVYQAGPGRTQEQVRQLLARAMAEGRLARHDPEFAADMFLSMLTGLDRTRLLLGELPSTDEEERARVVAVVDTFLRAFGPPLSPPEEPCAPGTV